jgi:hypothetical protein
VEPIEASVITAEKKDIGHANARKNAATTPMVTKVGVEPTIIMDLGHGNLKKRSSRYYLHQTRRQRNVDQVEKGAQRKNILLVRQVQSLEHDPLDSGAPFFSFGEQRIAELSRNTQLGQ